MKKLLLFAFFMTLSPVYADDFLHSPFYMVSAGGCAEKQFGAPQSFPFNGKTRLYSYNLTAEAPLEIITSGSGGYLVKLETVYGKDVMDIFVRGGETVEVEVPLGNYILKYVSGNVWHGYDNFPCVFGSSSNFNKATLFFRSAKNLLMMDTGKGIGFPGTLLLCMKCYMET